MANLQSVEPQYVEMKVPLYSYGCEKKIKKALSSLRGIYSVNVNYTQQRVTVWGICNKYDVLATIKNKRREAEFWNLEDNIKLLEMKVVELSQDSKYSDNSTDCVNNKANLTKTKSFSFRAIKKAFLRSPTF